MYCCKTARDDFVNILNCVGGPKEKERGFAFLKRIKVLPDDATAESNSDNHSEIFNKVQYAENKFLTIGGNIRKRSLTIFKFGDRIRAVTVTANNGFVRAARQQVLKMHILTNVYY